MATIPRLKLSPTQFRFINSKATINWLIGPQGEGKTFAGVMAMLAHIDKHPSGYKCRGIIIRDSFENIKRMTIPSINDALSAIPGCMEKFTWSDGGRQLDGPGIHVDLMGIADLGALTKIQGGEYAWVWLEEPAPILDKGNSGLPEEVFDVALSRTGRQPGSIGRMQITMNPADEDHWTYHKAIDDPINPIGQKPTYPELDEISSFILNIPYGENVNLPPMSRAATKAAYKDRPDLLQRYVEGDWAFVQLGVKVVPEYNEKLHRTKVKLDPIGTLPVCRFWDAGLNPTVVFYQVTSRGFVHILDTLVGDNIGMRNFIRTRVKPLIAQRYAHVKDWTDIGDPNASNREQSDDEVTASGIINSELDASFINGDDRWEPRREALKEIFSRMIDGEPMMKISCHEGTLNRALRGGWHYKKDNAGNVVREKPIKNHYSHPGDALSYGIAKLHPWTKSKQFTSDHTITKQRAASYTVKRSRRKHGK